MIDLEQIYRRCPIWLQNLLLNVYARQIQWHRYGQTYRAAVAALLEQESWPCERLLEYQEERLRRVVQVAYDRSRYYRQVFDREGMHPSDIKSLADLSKVPLLTKDSVREYEADLMTRRAPAPGWIEGHTSGTTGSPLAVWYDRRMCAINNAADWRQKTWAGMREGDWIGLVLGRVVVPLRQTRPPFWRYNRVQRQIWFSSFHMSQSNLRSYAREIERRKLKFLEGYPSTLFILGKYLVDRGITLPMNAVFTSSETLHTIQREVIESAFECRLFDFYGLAERTIFAGECEAHAGKHIAEEYGIVELVDETGHSVPHGQTGFMVGTSLHNEAMPMIRYLTGDVSRVRVEPCSCGRTSRRIDDVTTKAEDIIVTPDGRMISPSVLTHPFKPLKSIVKSQIVQESLDCLVIKLVPRGQLMDGEKQQLLGCLRERIGPEARIEIRVVDDIPREPSGKFRWVISRVGHSFLVPWQA